MHLEIDEVPPVRHPLIEQLAVMSFHQLIATLKFVIDPARHISQPLGRHTPSIPKSAIDGYGIFVLETLHYHASIFVIPNSAVQDNNI